MINKWLTVISAAILLLLAGFGVSRAGINDGLVASYNFNGNANDVSGHGHNATVHGASLTADRFGNPDSAYEIGEGDYIEIPVADEFDLTEQMERTISIWVKPSDTSGHNTCSGKGMETIFASTNGEEGSCLAAPMGGSGTPPDYACIGYWFGFRNGKLQFYLRNNESGGTNYSSIDGLAAPGVGQWSHIVVAISTVFDVSSHVAGENFGRVWVYINGVKQVQPGEDYSNVLGQPTGIIPLPSDYSHDKPLYVGARYVDRTPCFSPCVLDYTNREEGMGEFFTGVVDDLRIYNRVLSDDEVSQLKNQGAIPDDDPDNPGDNLADGAYNYYLPYFRSGGGYWSGFGISNSSPDHPANYSAMVYDKAGNLVKSVLPDPIPANGQASMAVFPPHDTTGWMWINSDQPLTGLSFFAARLMADVPFVDKVAKKLIIPHIAQNDQWDTYLMICNPGDDPVGVSLTCYDRQGSQAAFTGFTLPGRNSEVYPFSSFGRADLTGKVVIEVTSGDGVAAFALYTNEKVGGNWFSGINAVDPTATAFSNPF